MQRAREDEETFGEDQGALSDEFDPLLRVATPISLAESLQHDLHVSLPVADQPIADYLIGSLDAHGRLDCDTAEVAEMFGCDAGRVEGVLAKLQELAPPGVGARDLRECLLIQVDRLERSGVRHPHVREIIEDHWDDFTAHRFTELSRKLDIPYDALLDVRQFLRDHTRPFPTTDGDAEGSGQVQYIQPDVIIRQDGDSFTVEVAESRWTVLQINPLYRQLAREVAAGAQEVSAEEHEHLRTHLERARLFLKNMRQRSDTIRRISEQVIAHQEGFLRHGIRHLAPLTRAEVAQAIGLHESTVSRATANKFVQLPSRTIVPFSTFFRASLSIKDIIQELIANERAPLTDEDIVDHLRSHGHILARRTVSKYRGQLGIPPSTVR
jgi:RNA polymerase sigma-54 factor